MRFQQLIPFPILHKLFGIDAQLNGKMETIKVKLLNPKFVDYCGLFQSTVAYWLPKTKRAACLFDKKMKRRCQSKQV